MKLLEDTEDALKQSGLVELHFLQKVSYPACPAKTFLFGNQAWGRTLRSLEALF